VAVHRAARICVAARAGQVLISQATQAVVEDQEEEDLVRPRCAAGGSTLILIFHGKNRRLSERRFKLDSASPQARSAPASLALD
jgi:class 3 adenylate cyclase